MAEGGRLDRWSLAHPWRWTLIVSTIFMGCGVAFSIVLDNWISLLTLAFAAVCSIAGFWGRRRRGQSHPSS